MKAVLIAISLLLTAAPAQAQASRDDAVAVAQRTAPGRVLSVDKTQRDGRDVWRVKLVTDKGEVRVVHVDVESGRPQ